MPKFLLNSAKFVPGGWDLAYILWLERLTAIAKVATVLAGFDPSILRHSGIWGAADEALLNTVHMKNEEKNKKEKNPVLSSSLVLCSLVSSY